ncbi:hypothetical protein CAPTEDRAFT_224492, partial [Capitella teleta]
MFIQVFVLSGLLSLVAAKPAVPSVFKSELHELQDRDYVGNIFGGQNYGSSSSSSSSSGGLWGSDWPMKRDQAEDEQKKRGVHELQDRDYVGNIFGSQNYGSSSSSSGGLWGSDWPMKRDQAEDEQKKRGVHELQDRDYVGNIFGSQNYGSFPPPLPLGDSGDSKAFSIFIILLIHFLLILEQFTAEDEQKKRGVHELQDRDYVGNIFGSQNYGSSSSSSSSSGGLWGSDWPMKRDQAEDEQKKRGVHELQDRDYVGNIFGSQNYGSSSSSSSSGGLWGSDWPMKRDLIVVVDGSRLEALAFGSTYVDNNSRLGGTDIQSVKIYNISYSVMLKVKQYIFQAEDEQTKRGVHELQDRDYVGNIFGSQNYGSSSSSSSGGLWGSDWPMKRDLDSKAFSIFIILLIHFLLILEQFTKGAEHKKRDFKPFW